MTPWLVFGVSAFLFLSGFLNGYYLCDTRYRRRRETVVRKTKYPERGPYRETSGPEPGPPPEPELEPEPVEPELELTKEARPQEVTVQRLRSDLIEVVLENGEVFRSDFGNIWYRYPSAKQVHPFSALDKRLTGIARTYDVKKSWGAA